MIRKINNKHADYRRMLQTETDSELVLFLEYGESLDGIRFEVKEILFTINKEDKTTYPELQALVNEKLEDFENGNLLD